MEIICLESCTDQYVVATSHMWLLTLAMLLTPTEVCSKFKYSPAFQELISYKKENNSSLKNFILIAC